LSKEVEKKITNVLLVEDNPDDADLLRELLASSPEFRLTHAERLDRALDILSNGAFDVVLLDLSLPDSRGFETFSALHANAAAIPIIVLSGLSDTRLAVKTVNEGAQDYLVKGHVDSHLLVRAMQYAMERKRTSEKLTEYAERLRKRNEQMEEDLTMALEVQRAFLPQHYPSFPKDRSDRESAIRFCHRYEPTATLAGDFFEVLRISDEKAGAFICDVMGHGVRASLITAYLRGLIEQLSSVAGDPGSLLTELNRGLMAILERIGTPMFASAVYLVMDVSTNEVHVANAGHPAPLRLDRTRDLVEPLGGDRGEGGPALGLLEMFQYPTMRFPLEVNDLILLYTDGVFEVGKAQSDLYGEDRLRKALEERISLLPEQLLDEILAEVSAFSNRDSFPDDICLLAIEYAKAL
jgi:sigma-B regulation protein RsbU (phosphoserine phosphatase)